MTLASQSSELSLSKVGATTTVQGLIDVRGASVFQQTMLVRQLATFEFGINTHVVYSDTNLHLNPDQFVYVFFFLFFCFSSSVCLSFCLSFFPDADDVVTIFCLLHFSTLIHASFLRFEPKTSQILLGNFDTSAEYVIERDALTSGDGSYLWIRGQNSTTQVCNVDDLFMWFFPFSLLLFFVM